MVSGAGRRLTCRSVAACAARSVTVRGSSRYAAARAAATRRRSPAPARAPVSGGEFRVDGGPVRGGQAGGFAHEQGGAPFVQLPGLERGEGVRHLGHQGFGQAQEPAALGGGFVPGQGDLRADPGAELLRGDPGGGLVAALGGIEGDGDAGPAGPPMRDFRSSSSRIWSIIPALSVAGRIADSRAGGSSTAAAAVAGPAAAPAPGAVEASAAVSCRNHFGPLIAVHESSLLRGSRH